mgnify:FL=1
MEEILDIMPLDLKNFVLITLYSLVIGLSQRKLYLKEDGYNSFGSDRTFTLIGILGYILYLLDPITMRLYLCGGISIVVILAISYVHKIFMLKRFGITSIMIAFVTYGLAPLIYMKPLWVSVLIVVTVLILTEMKNKFIQFTKRMQDEEFINLAKFLIIWGVILPILPRTEIIEGLDLTPYSIWLATVVISGISYVSYLLKKYVFKDSGIIVSGILGGIYSSTATCVILAKKVLKAENNKFQYISAIFCAITMMYLKFMILLGIFNIDLLKKYCHIFLIMFTFSAIISVIFYFYYRKKESTLDKISAEEYKESNPLEFKVALIFASLFIAFTLITHYTLQCFGDSGLMTLSVLVGVTDINPFLINLFQSNNNVGETILIQAAFQAIISNNVVKMLYCIFFSKKSILKPLILGFGAICITNIILLLIFL